MKKDVLDQPVYEPGDTPTGLKRKLGAGPYTVVVAHVPGDNTWAAQVRAPGGANANLEGFESQAAILLWLNKLDWDDLQLHQPGPAVADAIAEE